MQMIEVAALAVLRSCAYNFNQVDMIMFKGFFCALYIEYRWSGAKVRISDNSSLHQRTQK